MFKTETVEVFRSVKVQTSSSGSVSAQTHEMHKATSPPSIIKSERKENQEQPLHRHAAHN